MLLFFLNSLLRTNKENIENSKILNWVDSASHLKLTFQFVWLVVVAMPFQFASGPEILVVTSSGPVFNIFPFWGKSRRHHHTFVIGKADVVQMGNYSIQLRQKERVTSFNAFRRACLYQKR